VLLEKWRAEMNAKADAERERNEAEHRAFAERRVELVRMKMIVEVRDWQRRLLLQRFAP